MHARQRRGPTLLSAIILVVSTLVISACAAGGGRPLGEADLEATVVASECAAEQDTFWEYHDYLFENWNGENQGAFAKDNLKRFAAEFELDTVAFDECIDSGRAEGIVQQDAEFSRQLGVRSTPTFAVSGKPVQDALPYDQFQILIEQELQNQ